MKQTSLDASLVFAHAFKMFVQQSFSIVEQLMRLFYVEKIVAPHKISGGAHITA